MVLKNRAQSKIERSEISANEVHHWPIVRSYLERIDVVGIVNQLVSSQMEVEPGLIVQGLVMDTLSGRSPLYHLESTFEAYDRALLFGEDLPASYFSDDNVGRTLDCLYAAGTQKIFSTLAVSAVKLFDIPRHHAHFDTTSVNVYGDYSGADSDEGPFKVTYGHSKDKRPDLKQFVLSTLCVGGDVPILGSVEDGNASDKVLNQGILSQISRRMQACGVEDGAFIYIADSAMVTESNLAELQGQTRFITRLPANYNECGRVILEAVEADDWTDIGVLSQARPSKNRPAAFYRGHESTVALYDHSYRAVVIHSSAHDKRRQKRLDRALQASEKELRGRGKTLEKTTFYCRADAQAAAEKAAKDTTAYHMLKVTVEERPQYPRGRPKKGEPRRPSAIHYGVKTTIVKDDDAITKARKAAGCFVMLTNVSAEGDNGYDSEKILRTYKDQYGVEKNFSFLKDDQIVNSLFLKRPERIEALGFILLISLLVWRLMEHQMRYYLEQEETTLPGWDNKPTQRPTAYMLTIKFKGLLILRLGTERQLARPLSDAQSAFLTALDLPATVFTQPPGAP